MTATYIDPLNLKLIIQNYLLGSMQLFTFGFVIIFSAACARFNMSNKVYFSLLIISSLIMAAYLGQSVYVLIIFLIGLITYKGVGAIMT